MSAASVGEQLAFVGTRIDAVERRWTHAVDIVAVTKGAVYVCMSSSELHTLQQAFAAAARAHHADAEGAATDPGEGNQIAARTPGG